MSVSSNLRSRSRRTAWSHVLVSMQYGCSSLLSVSCILEFQTFIYVEKNKIKLPAKPSFSVMLRRGRELETTEHTELKRFTGCKEILYFDHLEIVHSSNCNFCSQYSTSMQQSSLTKKSHWWCRGTLDRLWRKQPGFSVNVCVNVSWDWLVASPEWHATLNRRTGSNSKWVVGFTGLSLISGTLGSKHLSAYDETSQVRRNGVALCLSRLL